LLNEHIKEGPFSLPPFQPFYINILFMPTLNWFAADRLQGGSINTLIDDVLQVDFTALILVAKQIRYDKPEYDSAAHAPLESGFNKLHFL